MKREPPGPWAVHAACAGHDPNWWFPGRGEVVKHVRARAICMECPVRISCFRHALANRERQGIWGGVPFTNGKPRRGE